MDAFEKVWGELSYQRLLLCQVIVSLLAADNPSNPSAAGLKNAIATNLRNSQFPGASLQSQQVMLQQMEMAHAELFDHIEKMLADPRNRRQ